METNTNEPKKLYHEFVDNKYQTATQSVYVVNVFGLQIVPNEVYINREMTIRDFYAHLAALLLTEKPKRRLTGLVNKLHKWMPSILNPGNFESTEESTMKGSGQLGHNTAKFGDHNILHLYQEYANRERFIEYAASMIFEEKKSVDSTATTSDVQKAVSFSEFFDAAAWGTLTPADFNYNDTEFIGTKSFSEAEKFRVTIDNVLASNVVAFAQELVSSTESFMYAVARLRADTGTSSLRDIQTRDVKKKVAEAVAENATFIHVNLRQYQKDFIVHLEDLSKFIISQSDKKKFVEQFIKVFETYGIQLAFEAGIGDMFPRRGTLKERAKKKVAEIRGKTPAPPPEWNIREELTPMVKVLTNIGGERSTDAKKDLVYVHLNLLIAFVHLLYTDVQQAETYFFKAKNVAAAGALAGGSNVLPPYPTTKTAGGGGGGGGGQIPPPLV